MKALAWRDDNRLAGKGTFLKMLERGGSKGVYIPLIVNEYDWVVCVLGRSVQSPLRTSHNGLF